MTQEWNSLPHDEKYSALWQALKIKLPSMFMNRSTEKWQTLFKEDEHLNNVPLQEWDAKANWYRQNNGSKNPCRPGWSLSQSEFVCAFKAAVRDQIVFKNEVSE